jgi:hypothetical protein
MFNTIASGKGGPACFADVDTVVSVGFYGIQSEYDKSSAVVFISVCEFLGVEKRENETIATVV